MLFSFLKKQWTILSKKQIIWEMIENIYIWEEQKILYKEALDVVSPDQLEGLYDRLLTFIESTEMKQIQDIRKENFWRIAWMRKKEADEKMEELNNFSLLLHNL